MNAATAAPPPQAVRLIFAYDGDGVRLVHQQPVDVMIPGMDLPREELAGHFVEVRDVQGRRLSQVPIRSALSTTLEVFPENPEDPITTVQVAEPAGAFTVVVPVSPQADHVTVVTRQAPQPATAGADALSRGPAVELGTFTLQVPGPEVDR